MFRFWEGLSVRKFVPVPERWITAAEFFARRVNERCFTARDRYFLWHKGHLLAFRAAKRDLAFWPGIPIVIVFVSPASDGVIEIVTLFAMYAVKVVVPVAAPCGFTTTESVPVLGSVNCST